MVRRERGGKCEGMAARPNNPIGKARELQRTLFKVAKRQPKRRFHALFDRILRGDGLEGAWRRVRGNRGAAGVDGQTLAEVERRGVAEFLRGIRATLKAGKYRPQPVRRRYIPKPDGRQRPLGIPTVRDRVVQAAAKLVLEPIFEADFKDCSHGFRPKRGATGALETIRIVGGRGHRFVVDGDIKGFFDNIDQPTLMELVKRRITDRRVLKLLRQWLKAGVMEEGSVLPVGLRETPGLHSLLSQVASPVGRGRSDDARQRQERASARVDPGGGSVRDVAAQPSEPT